MADGQGKRPLWQIVNDVVRALADSDGEVTDALDALQLELSDKVEAYAAVCRQLELDAATLRAEAKHYAEKAAQAESQRDRLRERLQREMERLGTRNVKTPSVTAFIASTEAVEIDEDVDAATLPDTLCVVTRKPSKSAVKEAIKAGASFAWARVVSNASVRFK